ncbi:ATP-binding protein [Paraliomyxa miuraensis]|uniref:ATP-binding protein n=1 Tax=Paraliomyxa miuraensis TaxID=376150 RepID=UPI00224EF79B|nr:ATP-binding protein [Paraliomyxa miuraensis]MCX4244343.1 ATP-binding protein [Paraliomyxa miuraensis]
MFDDDDFVGRAAELRHLQQAYRSQISEFVVVYGRRRVGKTELLLHSLSDHPGGLYFMGKTAAAPLQLRELLQEAARVLDEPLLAMLHTTSWKEALSAIVSRWRGPGKLILILDEFQWMAGASPELPSVLQELWDLHWRDAGNLVLVLCGSFVGFMEREVLGRKSPLFGRRTSQIKLRPFAYHEAAGFHPGWSLSERARAYFVCGGIPAYLRRFDPSRSVEHNIEDQILDEFSALSREPEFLLREELREIDGYYAVLRALAAGSRTAAEIAAHTGLPERSLHYYIAQLDELGYLARRHPLTGAAVPKRTVRYVLEDPLLRFWFRFVFPNQSFIQQVGPRRAFRERIAPELPAYEGLCFERLCREALPVLYRAEGISAGFDIGEYWDKKVQIDVVGVRDDGWADLGECRWGTVRSASGLRRELDQKVTAWPNRRGATMMRRLFVRKKPARAVDADHERWHDLAGLYAAAESG